MAEGWASQGVTCRFTYYNDTMKITTYQLLMDESPSWTYVILIANTNSFFSYFLNGICREGANCHFSHDRQNSRPSMACRYYLRGTCTYGENCRYDHIRQEWLDGARKNMTSLKNHDSSRQHANSTQLTHRKETSHLHSFGKDSKTSISSSKNMTPLGLTARSPLCVDAPEFVPRNTKDETKRQVTSEVSFAQVVGNESSSNNTQEEKGFDPYSELCPYYLMSGLCQYEDCSYIHGLLCEICQLACLHPLNEKQRNSHLKECTKLMEAEMEHSFAVARSQEKVCGICMDTVMERSLPSQRRFGILPNCSHCFCIDCLRKWRQSKQFDNKIVRACPECRVQSDFVIPSRYWVDDKDKTEKEKLLLSYKIALSDKPCKYFKQGEGQCPFGNKCFYLHALPDGTKKDVGPPKRKHRFNAEGELQLYLDNMMLWDFIEEREHRLELLRGSIQTLLLELELDDLDEDLMYFPYDSLSEASDA